MCSFYSCFLNILYISATPLGLLYHYIVSFSRSGTVLFIHSLRVLITYYKVPNSGALLPTKLRGDMFPTLGRLDAYWEREVIKRAIIKM